MTSVRRRTFRADLLKALSAPTLLTLSSLVVIVPLLIVFMTGIADGLTAAEPTVATRTLLAIGVAGSLGCSFYGSYLVTRDDYYKAMDRSFLLAPVGIVYGSRIVVAATVGAGLSMIGVLVWTGMVALILASHGVGLTLEPAMLALGLGIVVSGGLTAIIGCAVGWVVRNYYATIVVLLVLPSIVAPPMLARLRDVERFLPIGAVAGLGGVPLDGLFGQVTAGAVLAGWSALAVAAGWIVVRRRAKA